MIWISLISGSLTKPGLERKKLNLTHSELTTPYALLRFYGQSTSCIFQCFCTLKLCHRLRLLLPSFPHGLMTFTKLEFIRLYSNFFIYIARCDILDHFLEPLLLVCFFFFKKRILGPFKLFFRVEGPCQTYHTRTR